MAHRASRPACAPEVNIGIPVPRILLLVPVYIVPVYIVAGNASSSSWLNIVISGLVPA